jgi:putative ABC transport system ATP-binding protein
MLDIRNLTKSFGGPAGRRVLDGVSLTVQPGEYVAIAGESGVGKSTLLNLIAGLDVPDSGEVLLEGRDLARMDENARTLVRRSRMGFVFQAFHLLPHLSIARNVGLPLALNGKAAPPA